MCLNNCIKGWDSLNWDILDTNYSSDINDNCDYIEYNTERTLRYSHTPNEH